MMIILVKSKMGLFVYNKLNITILEEEESGDTKSYFFNFESKLERLTWLEM